jgi:hypothetical protein
MISCGSVFTRARVRVSLALSLAVLPFAVSLAACNDETGTTTAGDDDTGVGQGCTTDFDCKDGQICNPATNKCVAANSTGGTDSGTSVGPGGDDDDDDSTGGTGGTGGTGTTGDGDDDDDFTGPSETDGGASGGGFLPVSDLEVCVDGPQGKLCSSENGGAPQYDFGRVPANTTSQPVKITATNKAATDITISATNQVLGLGNEFALTGGVSNKVLKPGEAIQLSATFTPVRHGDLLAAWQFEAADQTTGFSLTGSGIAAKLCPNPSFNVAFGDVPVGTTARQELTFTNCGSDTLSFTQAAIAQGSGVFTVTTNKPTPTDLDPARPGNAAQTIVVTVAYTPTQAGSTQETATVNIGSSIANGTLNVSGRGVNTNAGCKLEIYPTALDFGTVTPATRHTGKLILLNQSQGDCQVTNVQVAGATFSLPNGPTTGFTVPKGGRTSFDVRFSPADTSKQTGSVTVAVSGQGNLATSLVGNGPIPSAVFPPTDGCALLIDPPVIDFGPATQPTTIKVGIKNQGTDSCEITKVNFNPQLAEFTFPNAAQVPSGGIGGNSIDLAAGAVTIVDVRFTPASAKTPVSKTTIEVGTNGTPFSNVISAKIPAIGQAQSASLCAVPNTLDFGRVRVGAKAIRAMTFVNCGSTGVTVNKLSFPAGGGGFGLDNPPTFPFTLNVGESLPVDIAFQTKAPGKAETQLTATLSDGGTAAFTVKGEARDACNLACRPADFDFGKVSIGDKRQASFFCANFGDEPLTVERAVMFTPNASEFQFSRESLPKAIPPGKSTRFDVLFAPTSSGGKSGTVYVEASGCETEAIQLSFEASAYDASLPTCRAASSYNPQVVWEWNAKASVAPNFNNVFMTPILAPLEDTNGDGAITAGLQPRGSDGDIPYVVASAIKPDLSAEVTVPAIIKLINGKTGADVINYTVPAALSADGQPKQYPVDFSASNKQVHWGAMLAAGDIDGDRIPEIIGTRYRKLPKPPTGCPQINPFCGEFRYGTLVAFKPWGELVWESDEWTGDVNDLENYGIVSIADLDGDGDPEIIYGNHVFRNDGSLWWRGTAGRGNGSRGYQGIVVDLDGDGLAEVVAGNTAYRFDGTIMWQFKNSGGLGGIEDGPAAVADLDLDGRPEVITSFGSGIFYLDGQTGAKIAGPLLGPGAGCCSTAPAVADLTGDGFPEVVVSNRPVVDDGDSQTQDPGLLSVLDKDGTIVWQNAVSDLTGASVPAVFDFEGDGPWEVVYADESQLYILRGSNGNILYTSPRQSRTGFDMPIVADIDNDGFTEIVLSQEGLASIGLRAYRTEPNAWLRSRGIWNQFDMTFGNIRDDMTVPPVPPNAYRTHNSFHGNLTLCKQPSPTPTP